MDKHIGEEAVRLGAKGIDLFCFQNLLDLMQMDVNY